MSGGAVAASVPEAVAAGAEILNAGGNAVDAAVATCLAVAVADPANASIAGCGQVLVRLRGGQLTAIDGASRTPAVPLPHGLPVPLPGLLPALAEVQTRFGTRSLSARAAPAAALARTGAAVTPALARIWRRQASRLLEDPAASRFYLRADGSAPQAGDRMPNLALATCLERWGAEGSPRFACADCREGETVCAEIAGWRVAAAGRQGWGHTLVEMMELARRLDMPDVASPKAWEARALVLLSALEDRPQFAGTLAPKPGAIDWRDLLAPDRLEARSHAIAAALGAKVPVTGHDLGSVWPDRGSADRDTTHLSIGPHFGSATADPKHGFLCPHSYRMAAGPRTGEPDHTEMTPTIAWHPDGRILAIGAAGSERIPGAIAQVPWRIMEGEDDLAAALAAPRIAWHGGRLRLQKTLGAAVIRHFQERGYRPDVTGTAIENHAGVVHAALWEPKRPHQAAADPAYDGAAWTG